MPAAFLFAHILTAAYRMHAPQSLFSPASPAAENAELRFVSALNAPLKPHN
jgi:hypothetical protein